MSDADVSDDAPQWRWVDGHGAQSIVDEWDLVASLSSGQLPPYTLVWRTGWAEWLPANKVAELSTALPVGKAESPRMPRLEPGLREPPPPPLDFYTSEPVRSAAARLAGGSTAPGLGGKAPKRQQAATPPLPPGVDPATRGSAMAASLVGKAGIFATPAPPPPPTPQRPPMPTLVDMPRQGATVTLRPPGAIPPPPRTMPLTPRRLSADDAFDQRGGDAVATPIPPPIESKDRTQNPPAVNGEPPPLSAEAPLPSWSDELDAEGRPSSRRAGAGLAGPSGAPAAASRPPIALVVLGSVAGVLAVLVVVLLVLRSREPTNSTVGVPEAPGVGVSSETAPSAGPCTLVRPARILSSLIFLGVPPSIAAVPGNSSRFAVGLAVSRTLALGITVDLANLGSATVFRQPGAVPLIGVVPLTAEGALRFAADREGGPLANARSIDDKPPFTVGIAEQGVAVSDGGAEPRVVWPSTESEGITEIRVASVSGVGHALTFRRGGQAGRVLAGWLGPGGKKQSELEPVTAPARFVGTPIVATNDREALVAFANRGSPDEYWTLAIATAPHGKVPQRARRFSTPPGGRGAGAIAPAVGGLRNGRWLLQWTEGGSGQHQVRLQTVDADLVAVGDPIEVSPNEANAGQGAVWVQGQTAISLFVVTKGTNNELWGASLQCP